MTVRALGDTWLPGGRARARRTRCAGCTSRRSPGATSRAETLAAAARGRRLSLDGQGLVRARRTGPLELDADFDPELLRHVWVLKLSDEEAEVLGDPLALGVRELARSPTARAGRPSIADGRVEHVPAFAIDGDPTGAGDALLRRRTSRPARPASRPPPPRGGRPRWSPRCSRRPR